MNTEVCGRLSEFDPVLTCSFVDPTFIKTFLMTFKSFTTVDELFELLVLRFNIQPPPNLTPEEHQDWAKLKQHVIQMRWASIFEVLVLTATHSFVVVS